MAERYLAIFWELVHTPFRHTDLIWGIVPLYFGWILNELTAKASFATAVNTGFSFLWAGAHWVWQYFPKGPSGTPRITWNSLFAVNILVTLLVLVIGLLGLYSGIRRRYPTGCGFLGHSRFGNYFMIAIFPIQSGLLPWSWNRLTAILVMAVPVWIAAQLAVMLVRTVQGGGKKR